MANAETKDSSHGPATVETEILEFAQTDTFNYEHQPPRAGFIALISGTCLAFILIIMFGLHAYWNWYWESTMEQQNLGRDSQMLRDLRQREDERLRGIDQAMQAIVREASDGTYGKNYVASTAASPSPSPGASPSAPATPAAAPAAPPAKKQ